MKKILYLALALMLLSMQSCKQNKSAKVIVANDSVAETEVTDSTIMVYVALAPPCTRWS